jgi:kumamolisin
MADQDRHQVPGSDRMPVTGARRVADAPAGEEVLISIVVRRKPGGTERALEAASSPDPRGSRPQLRRRLREETGADPAEIERVVRFVTGSGLEVLSADPATRMVVARGTVEQADAAFGVSLGRYEAGDLSYRGREGHVQVPPDLVGIVDAVLGLDDRPQARDRAKHGDPVPAADLPDTSAPGDSLLPAMEAEVAAAHRPRPQPQPLWPRQVAALYDFPADYDGSGETIAILEFDGGYTNDELAEYFRGAGTDPAPNVEVVSIDGGQNRPGGGGDEEVLLDIEVCGAIAPGARIAVYFAENSDRGFLSALTNAIHDPIRSPSVISVSWGDAEAAWTTQARHAFDDALIDATALGVTVLAGAGDHGAGDGVGEGGVHADFPASSPRVIGCGGTTLFGDGDEVVWNDGDGWASGGGISDVYEVPSWQNVRLPGNLGCGGPGRGVPDIAGNADTSSGYITLIHGRWRPSGGTSAVAPLYAGLVARLNQALGRPVTRLLPALYSIPAGAASEVLHDITVGDNAVPQSEFGPATEGYRAGEGWDACTGLGSLRGSALLGYLRTAAEAAPARV